MNLPLFVLGLTVSADGVGNVIYFYHSKKCDRRFFFKLEEW